jgi:hypothetical protein
VELTLLRSPMALGDCLADLHAMVSLLAQLHVWIPISVASARAQDYPWSSIAAQLEVSPATARRRHRSRTLECDRHALERWPDRLGDTDLCP